MRASSARTFIIIAAVIVSAATAVGFALFPHIADDLFSASLCRQSYLYGEPVSAEAYLDKVRSILYGNHFRLCNLLMPLVILLPRWLPAAISGIALFFIYLLAARLGRCDRRPLRFALLVLVLTVAYPWLDQLYLTSFQLPYLWGVAAAVGLLWLLLYEHDNCTLAAMAGYIVGFWHELAAGALLVTIVATCIRYPRMRRLSVALAAVGLGLGIATIAVSFLFSRSGTAYFLPEIHRVATVAFLFPSFIYLLVGTCRFRYLDSLGFSLFVATATSTAICFYFCVGPRTTAFGTLCALAGLFRLLPGRRLIPARLSAISAVMILAAVVAHYVAVDAMSRRLSRETKYILDAYSADPHGTVFAPMTLREDASPLLLGKPYYDWWAHSAGRRVFEWMYSTLRHTINVVPRDLRGFTPVEAAHVPGSESIFLYRGHVVALPGTPDRLVADYGLGPRERRFSAVTFRSGADGREYLWIHPESFDLDFYGFHNPSFISCQQSSALDSY